MKPNHRGPRCSCVLKNEEIQTARQTLRQWNFDPDEVTKPTCDWYESSLLRKQHPDCIPYVDRLSTPMVIMAHLNDLTTMKYILQQATSRGTNAVNVLTQTDDFGLFPLYTAISDPHDEETVLKTVQWLVQNGADVQQTVHGLYTAFRRATFKGFSKVATWLVIEAGAFLCEESVEFCHSSAKRLMQPVKLSYDTAGCTWTSAAHADDIHQHLFEWAAKTLETRSNFSWMMLGTKRSSSSLQVLNGHPGMMEHIAQFAGVETRQTVLVTARGLLGHKVWYDLCERTPL
ncbi:ankyrin repeat domain protein [Nitzschia inconspicua]|uniref:Ankyrin repeat domain protein n=1 Tax=Nitzschia inconspicua TaxID=303405 RepID=A0A9K3PSK3_9STRA|nr:ankyrin repeat domain protein [Nitzschia inconspicua]